jgi:inner membrane protein
MASLLHLAMGSLGARIATGGFSRPLRPTTLLFGAALGLLPDADVLGMALGIPYAAPWGHRGASHSLLLAGLLSLSFGIGAYFSSGLRPALWVTAGLSLALLSHAPLDALTDGGLGVALLWPWSNERIFFPFRPIPVAPIGFGMWSQRGLQVLLTESIVALPLLALSLFRPRGQGIAVGSVKGPKPKARG